MSEVREEATPPAENPTEMPAQKPNNIEALERKNRELLGKMAALKAELSGSKETLSKLEQDKLESQGKYADIAEARKKRIEELEKSLDNEKKRFASTNLTNIVKQKALEMGSKYPDLVLKAISSEDLALIQVDDNYQPDQDATKTVLEKMKSDYPELFTKQSVGVKDFPANPSGAKVPTSEKKISEMTMSELKEFYRKHRN